MKCYSNFNELITDSQTISDLSVFNERRIYKFERSTGIENLIASVYIDFPEGGGRPSFDGCDVKWKGEIPTVDDYNYNNYRSLTNEEIEHLKNGDLSDIEDYAFEAIGYNVADECNAQGMDEEQEGLMFEELGLFMRGTDMFTPLKFLGMEVEKDDDDEDEDELL